MDIILEEGEVICGKCEGEGSLPGEVWCPKCNGVGKLDWISNAMGTPPSQTVNTIPGSFVMANPEPNRIWTGDGKLIIAGDYLEIEAKDIKISDEALESLVDSIERKLSERKIQSETAKDNP